MMSFTRIAEGLLISFVTGLAVLTATAAGSDEPRLNARVQLEFSLPEGLPTEIERSRALKRLIDRLMAFGGPMSTAPESPFLVAASQGLAGITAGQGLDGIYVDVGGLNCDHAQRFVEGAVFDQDEIEFGLVGSPPIVRSWDVARAWRTTEGHLNLLLRNEAAKRLRDLTATHIGQSAYFRFAGSGSGAVIPIQAVIDSGRMQLREEHVPADFARRPILGYPAKATGCELQQDARTRPRPTE